MISEDRLQDLNNRYESLLSTAREVLSIFIHYYGEDRVDFQYPPFNTIVAFYQGTRLYTLLTENQIAYLINEKLPEESISSLSLKTAVESDEIYDAVKDIIVTEKKIKPLLSIQRTTASSLYGVTIVIYYPEVTVENERGETHVIRDTYIKVPISLEGKLLLTFFVNRATYTHAEWNSSYLHSHVNGIPKNNIFQFKSGCLGSGPIEGTQKSLNIENDEYNWMAFAMQLDQYLQVESEDGGPYYHLNQIQTKKKYNKINLDFSNNQIIKISESQILVAEEWSDFMNYLINKDIFRFTAIGNVITLANNTEDLFLDISNTFIEWVNTKEYFYYNRNVVDHQHNIFLRHTGILNPAIYENGSFYYTDGSVAALPSEVNQVVLTFKGEEKTLTIIQDEQDDDRVLFLILNPSIITTIVYKILMIINSKYDKYKEFFSTNPVQPGTEISAGTPERLL